MYVCMYAYVYICICMYVYTYVCMCICVYICMYVYICIHIYVCMCICVYIHTASLHCVSDWNFEVMFYVRANNYHKHFSFLSFSSSPQLQNSTFQLSLSNLNYLNWHKLESESWKVKFGKWELETPSTHNNPW